MLRKIIEKILLAIAAIGSGLSVIFYVMFELAREEQKVEEAENEGLKSNLEAMQAAEEAVREERKANEELVENANGSNKLDAFDACNQLLQK